jgi:hypothetical protein
VQLFDNPMSRAKALFTLLVATLTLTVAFSTTSAMAELPDLNVGAGGSYPVTGTGTVEEKGAVVSELETEIGEKLTATKETTTIELTKLTSLGPSTQKFTGVEEPKSKTKCKSSNTTVEGEVLFNGEYHVVRTSLAPSTAGVLFLFEELTVECNSKRLKLKIKAPALVKLNVTPGTEVTEAFLETACTKGKQEPREYYNEEGKLTAANLLANFGLGFEKACHRGKRKKITFSFSFHFLF